jgi:hypothetical protein
MPGLNGTDGTDGADGTDGTNGTNGMDGEPGPPGPPGVIGAVIPPYLDVYGRSQAEWTAEWWRWAAAMPAMGHPLFDQTGSDCGRGQDRRVFFIGGTYIVAPTPTGIVGTATRTCTVDADEPIFFPIINSFYNNIGAAQPEPDEALVAGAELFGEPVTNLSLTIDGVPQTRLYAHAQTSEAFNFTYPDGSIFDTMMTPLPAGSSNGADHGYWVMLAPLEPGIHRVHFRGKLELTTAVHGFDFTVEMDIVYNLDVPPSR